MNMKHPLRLLLVEATNHAAQPLLEVLQQLGYDVFLECIHTIAAFESALQQKSWDIIVANTELSDFDIPTALISRHRLGPEIPFFAICSASHESFGVQAMEQGAQDYIVKNHWQRLGPAIERELKIVELRRQHLRAQETVSHQSQYDLLTDLPNRQLFKDCLVLALAYAQRHRHMAAVLFVDLDRFKTIIDTLGHMVGDQVLRSVSDRLRSSLSTEFPLARLGGDEFVVLLPQIERADQAVKMVQKIVEALKAPFHLNGHELHITASIGVSLYPYDGEDADTLLKNADTALYRAKEQGRNTYQLYTPAMNARSFERLAMENSLRKAIERNEFLLHYQPQVDLKSGKIISVEALVRWQHPDLGIVYPSEFIHLAEETGLIVPLGEWVLRAAAQQAKAWQSDGLPPMAVAVNLSARQFRQQDLVESIARVLRETELDPQYLDLEITESIAMENADYSVVILKELKARGVTIAVDDFGTGYSSLSYLRRFPITSLKIDQSFVRDLQADPNDAAIADAIIALAHSLKLIVLAEGVETDAQLRFLKQHGCDRAQGFLFSRALPADDLPAYIKSLQPLAV